LQKKGKKFEWAEKCEEGFNKLKELLTSTPILKITDPHKEFVICTNACNEGLGGVLTQDGHVIAYESRKLKIHERNYATYDLELVAIIHALKMWRHYLIGRRFLLMLDNICLKYLFDQQNMNVRQARWLDFLSEYEFEIKHIKGKENKVADALIKNAILGAISNYKTDLEENIKEKEGSDMNYQKLKDKVAGSEAKIAEFDYEITENGLLIYKNRLYIPNIPEIKLLILNELHKSPYSGHLGYQKRITMLRKYFFWPNMKNEVAKFLTRCMECQQVKAEHQHPAGLLQPLPIP